MRRMQNIGLGLRLGLGVGAGGMTKIGPRSAIWTGDGGTNIWSDATNWDGNKLPREEDTVIFPTGTPDCRIDVLATLPVTGMHVEGGYAGTLLFEQSVELADGFTQDGGIVDTGGFDLTCQNLDVSAGSFFARASTILVSGPLLLPALGSPGVFDAGTSLIRHGSGTLRNGEVANALYKYETLPNSFVSLVGEVFLNQGALVDGAVFGSNTIMTTSVAGSALNFQNGTPVFDSRYSHAATYGLCARAIFGNYAADPTSDLVLGIEGCNIEFNDLVLDPTTGIQVVEYGPTGGSLSFRGNTVLGASLAVNGTGQLAARGAASHTLSENTGAFNTLWVEKTAGTVTLTAGLTTENVVIYSGTLDADGFDVVAVASYTQTGGAYLGGAGTHSLGAVSLSGGTFDGGQALGGVIEANDWIVSGPGGTVVADTVHLKQSTGNLNTPQSTNALFRYEIVAGQTVTLTGEAWIINFPAAATTVTFGAGSGLQSEAYYQFSIRDSIGGGLLTVVDNGVTLAANDITFALFCRNINLWALDTDKVDLLVTGGALQTTTAFRCRLFVLGGTGGGTLTANHSFQCLDLSLSSRAGMSVANGVNIAIDRDLLGNNLRNDNPITFAGASTISVGRNVSLYVNALVDPQVVNWGSSVMTFAAVHSVQGDLALGALEVVGGTVTQDSNITCVTLTVTTGTWDTNSFNLTTTGSSLNLNGGEFFGRSGTHDFGSLTITTPSVMWPNSATIHVRGNITISNNTGRWIKETETLIQYTGTLSYDPVGSSFGNEPDFTFRNYVVAAGETVSLLRQLCLHGSGSLTVEAGGTLVGSGTKKDVYFRGGSTVSVFGTIDNLHMRYWGAGSVYVPDYNGSDLSIVQSGRTLANHITGVGHLHLSAGNLSTAGYNIDAVSLELGPTAAASAGASGQLNLQGSSEIHISGTVSSRYGTGTNRGLVWAADSDAVLYFGGNLSILDTTTFKIEPAPLGKIVFEGSLDQLIRTPSASCQTWNDLEIDKAGGAVTFADPLNIELFRCHTPSQQLVFNAGSTYGIAELDLDGLDVETPITLVSSVPGSEYFFTLPGTETANAVDVADCHASDTITATDSYNSGNTVNWFFSAVTFTWTGAGDGTSWTDPDNWYGLLGQYPVTAGHSALIDNTAQDLTIPAGLTLYTLTVGGNYTGTLTQAGSLTLVGGFYLQGGTYSTAGYNLVTTALSLTVGVFNAGASAIEVESITTGAGATANWGTSVVTFTGVGTVSGPIALGALVVDGGTVTQDSNITCVTLTVTTGTWDTNGYNLTTTGASLNLNGGEFNGRTGTHILGSLTVLSAALVTHTTATYEVHGDCTIAQNRWIPGTAAVRMHTGVFKITGASVNAGGNKIKRTVFVSGHAISVPDAIYFYRDQEVVFEAGSVVEGAPGRTLFQCDSFGTLLYDDQGAELRNLNMRYHGGITFINKTTDFSNNCSLYFNRLVYELDADIVVSRTLGWNWKNVGLRTNGYNVTVAEGLTIGDPGNDDELSALYLSLGSIIQVGGNFSLSASATRQTAIDFSNGGGEIRVAGNFSTPGAAFSVVEPSAGKLVLDGSAAQSVGWKDSIGTLEVTNADAAVTFTHAFQADLFKCITPNASIAFAPGLIYPIGALEIDGQAVGTEVSLRSSTPGMEYFFTTLTPQEVAHVDVQDNNSTEVITAIDSIDSGNTTNWVFGDTVSVLGGTLTLDGDPVAFMY